MQNWGSANIIRHGLRRWAAITAKHNDAVIGVEPLADFLDKGVPEVLITVRILSIVKKEESEGTLTGKCRVDFLEALVD